MSAESSSRPRDVRALAVRMLAGVVLAAQLGAALHFVVVPHRICPLDGELVHDGRHAHHAAVATGAAPRAPAATPEGDEAAEGHEHCAVAMLHRERATVERADASRLLPAAVAAVALPLDTAPRPSRAVVLLLAPKHSPPV